MIVLDTSALLASLHNEPGKDRVDNDLLTRPCAMSSVNLAEFASKCLDGGMTHTDFDTLLASLELTIIPLDTALAIATGALRKPTRPLGLSLGDRACLATAQKLNATVLTADRAWLTLAPALGIAIESLRP